MADLTITAANVVKGANAVVEFGTSGATITAGQAVYQDTSDSNKFKLADCDNVSAIARTVYGIALHGASAGQPLAVQRAGDLTIGATLTVAEIYCLSDTAGGIRPEADNLTGDYVSIIGVATSASVLSLSIKNSGVAVP